MITFSIDLDFPLEHVQHFFWRIPHSVSLLHRIETRGIGNLLAELIAGVHFEKLGQFSDYFYRILIVVEKEGKNILVV